ncbi:hypothetical protein N9V90_00255 [Endozoicomonas sp.]|nr:hypothetical protein [Endozoicomonas sp.]
MVTSSLRTVNFATAGAIHPLEGAETMFESLLHSSSNAMLMDADAFGMMMEPNSLYKDFKPTGDAYTLIARVTGKVKTAYPDGRPKEKVAEDGKDKKGAGKAGADTTAAKEQTEAVKEESPKHPHLTESERPINVIIVTDTDVLADRLWVQKTQFFGQEIVQPFANNGDLLINMVDNLLGNADLISIRSRGQFSRPFDRVNELEREAEASFHKKEDELKRQLSDTESKLRALQTKKEGAEKLVLSAEQEQEVEKFMQEKLKIRKELREVQHQLGKDIENLGAKLKLLNILAVPMLITLIILGFRFYRRRVSK